MEGWGSRFKLKKKNKSVVIELGMINYNIT